MSNSQDILPPLPPWFVNPKKEVVQNIVQSPLKGQVGGDHYKNLPIQPIEYAMKNKLDPLQASVVKYVTRFRDKSGRVDLEKAIHCLELLIQFEYGDK